MVSLDELLNAQLREIDDSYDKFIIYNAIDILLEEGQIQSLPKWFEGREPTIFDPFAFHEEVYAFGDNTNELSHPFGLLYIHRFETFDEWREMNPQYELLQPLPKKKSVSGIIDLQHINSLYTIRNLGTGNSVLQEILRRISRDHFFENMTVLLNISEIDSMCFGERREHSQILQSQGFIQYHDPSQDPLLRGDQIRIRA